MTIKEFEAVVLTIDPEASRYAAFGQSETYTVWNDYQTQTLYANGVPVSTIVKVQVDYFTKQPDDQVADSYFEAFSQNDEISVTYLTDFEEDTGYIHHIFDCQVVA